MVSVDRTLPEIKQLCPDARLRCVTQVYVQMCTHSYVHESASLTGNEGGEDPLHLDWEKLINIGTAGTGSYCILPTYDETKK